MNTPAKCVVCKNSLEIVYQLPGWMRYNTFEGGGSYGGPISVPQCKSCGASAYHDSKGWHIKKVDYRQPQKMITIGLTSAQ